LYLYISIALTMSLLVTYSVTWVNETLFKQRLLYYTAFAHLKYGEVLMICSMAVVPALVEEFGFRAYLLNMLCKVVDEKQAIIISAFLFSIIHLSFISLYWLIPFSLFLGYLFVKEKTVWYGVAVHFAFNLTACILELY
jgi:uncharacterized protein